MSAELSDEDHLLQSFIHVGRIDSRAREFLEELARRRAAEKWFAEQREPLIGRDGDNWSAECEYGALSDPRHRCEYGTTLTEVIEALRAKVSEGGGA